MNEQESNVSFFRFEDLRIYAKAHDYILWVHNATNNFPVEKKCTVTDAFVKAAQGIALNMAEGSARNKTQFVYYLKMSKSSLRECVVYTEITAKLGLLNDEQREYSRNQLMELTKMIGSLISSLQRSTTTFDRTDELDDMGDIM